MPGPFEIIDDVTPALMGGLLPVPPVPPGLQFVVRVGKKPYLPGSVRVFRNGLLQHQDNISELDPTDGTVGFFANVFEFTPKVDWVHVRYLTFEPVFLDPDAPIHISQVRAGDVLRISLKAGHHLNPVVSRRGQQPRLEVSDQRRATKGSSHTTILGFLTANDPQVGVLHLQVEHPGRRSGNQFAATVSYADIRVIQKFLTPAKYPRAVPVGGGPRAVRQPGVVAKGMDGFVIPRLVRVRF